MHYTNVTTSPQGLRHPNKTMQCPLRLEDIWVTKFLGEENLLTLKN